MLFKTLDAIRQKPKPVRDQYAFFFAVLCTFLIAGVWSMSLPSKLQSTSLASVSGASTTAPFGGLWAEFRSKFTPPPVMVVPTTEATATTPTSSAPTTATVPVAALDLQLSQENMTTVNASSSAAELNEVVPVTILIGTTTSTTVSTD